MSHEVLLRADALEKTFRIGFWRKKVEAVRGVSFAVHRGEIFGLVGPNGAGKTTTMKMLTGLIFPDKGRVEMFGEPVTRVDVRRKLGYLPENPYFYEHLTARELVSYYGHLHGLPTKVIDKRTDRLLEMVKLQDAQDRPLRKFSKGMRQRAGIAQALINDPELIILDEPQSGLDPVGRKEVRDLILQLKHDGKTVYFSSHILPDVEAVCDRVAVMHRGQVQEIGALDELTSQRQIGVEVQVRGLSLDEARTVATSFSADMQGQLVVLSGPGDADVDDLIGRLIAAGGSIHSVTSQQENLEDVFLRDTDTVQ